MNMPLVLLKSRRRGFTAFSPSTLFALSEPGVWFDPSDTSTLFQDPAGTTPVTAPGNTVGLMLDKSKGLVLGAELVANGTFDTNTNNWTAINSTLSVDANRLKVLSAASYGWASQAFTTVIGKTYKISFDITNGDSSGVYIFVGTDAGLTAANYDSGAKADGSHFAVFTATATTTYFKPTVGGTGKYAFFDNISVRELAGNHATQATLAARPTYSIEPVGGRRNQLLWSENYSNAVWTKTNLTVSSGVSDPLGGTSAFTVTATGANGDLYQAVTTSNVNHKNSIWVRRRTGTGIIQIRGPQGQTNENITVTSEWQRFTSNAGLPFQGTGAYTGIVVLTAGDAVDIWGAQQELGTVATAYQRVTTQHDVTEAGVASVGYLYFDGASDSMVTSTITPGTDKAQVFAGVRRITDTIDAIAEFSTNWNASDGSFLFWGGTSMATGTGPGFNSGARGNAAAAAAQAGISPTTFAPPVTAVLTVTHDISGDLSSVRGNGVAGVNGTADKGTGNFLAYPLNIGRRFDGSFPLEGHIYSIITRFGPTLDAPTIANTETWVAGKTGFYTPIITGVPTIGVS